MKWLCSLESLVLVMLLGLGPGPVEGVLPHRHIQLA
jgi:hypothetical protein